METTATRASFHNAMKEQKAATVALFIKFLSLLPARLMLLGIVINLLLMPFGTAIPTTIWIPLVMNVIFLLQLAIRYLADGSFELTKENKYFMIACSFECIWFMGLIKTL
ncbi:MAG: hypothetical protein JWM92_227 [Candidatus Nomurabacteria bacterium]|jgi:hypothetical protein|nr:hypothetical protein [Candidatus Nomurabacteria bacterium]